MLDDFVPKAGRLFRSLPLLALLLRNRFVLGVPRALGVLVSQFLVDGREPLGRAAEEPLLVLGDLRERGAQLSFCGLSRRTLDLELTPKLVDLASPTALVLARHAEL